MSGKWNVVRRVIDGGRDWYEETFLDRGAGLIVHRQASPFRDNADFERFLEDLRKAGWKG